MQEAYIKVYGKAINEAYFYWTLRSLTMDLHRQRKNITNVEIKDDILFTDPEDENHEEHINDKAKPYKEFIDTWDWYDKKLFMIYVNENISMRKLSRETGIGFMSIYHTIKTCRQKLKQWQKEKEERLSA